MHALLIEAFSGPANRFDIIHVDKQETGPANLAISFRLVFSAEIVALAIPTLHPAWIIPAY